MTNRRAVAAIAIVLLALSGIWSVNAQTTVVLTPTATEPEIELQEIVVDGRRYTVDPYDLFACFITERTIRLGQEGGGLESEIALQCFVRDGDAMVALEPTRGGDFGVSTGAEVGQAIISAPQVETDRESLDG